MRLSLIEWEEEVDLRTVSWNVMNLEQVVQKHRLNEGQGVLYTNVANTKFRIICVLRGMPVLLIPPTATSHEALLSLYLQVSQYMRKLAAPGDMQLRLDERITLAAIREAEFRARHRAGREA